MAEDKTLISVRNLKKYFKVGRGQILKAVDDVSFDIKVGETLGLVGESGCGKSTTGRTIIRLYEPTGGDVIFDDINVSKLNKAEQKKFTREAQMIFQDPYASLNPRMTVTDIIGEGIDIHNLYTGMERQKRIYELLELVGLSREHANRFPHEFSGGQRQRIGIARALAIEPKFIVCDEPISALDVSIQAQVVNLLQDLQKELGLTYLFIAHDLSMVKHISDRVAVMYLGSIVELTTSNEIYNEPLHPYTKALMSAVPIPDPEVSKAKHRILLEGDVPSPINIPPGCKFQGRCPLCQEICKMEEPELREVKPGHFVACHLVK
ncbi:oligopeptide transport system ATP-binding protein [Dethiosulfatibacter aminovorans DSM 17477]|uniref:Oligopeptide transport system ATP-binding protein n=1 Tax=Dethiosulfatibacter aminovorans DSM 17477 TaxID=1121476 RepID=A0A1M6FWF8_9FIRM|nr:oligopeptide/dipeptide ABC transporter ATP-binding protein [Dethiosulfatibacter aminovorans]SHJ02041.1 oligopeptide transport system ATP-binding protein [Dethiosulfatibacter aminovorans DSM 17477]